MKDRRIIVNSNCYHSYSVYDAVDGIAGCGFHAVELTATKGWTEHAAPSMSLHELAAIASYIEKKGLEIPSMSGHVNLMDDQRIDDFLDNIRLAHFFGASIIVSSIGEAHLQDRQKGGIDTIRRNLDRVLPLLDRYGMNLVLETHGEHGTGTAIRDVVRQIDSPLVGICYDTANVIFYGGVKGTEDLEASADWVRYVHIKDKAGKEKEWSFPALGKGYVDFPALLRVLDEHDNPSPLSIEIEFTQQGARDLDEVNQAVRDSAQYLISLGYAL